MTATTTGTVETKLSLRAIAKQSSWRSRSVSWIASSLLLLAMTTAACGGMGPPASGKAAQERHLWEYKRGGGFNLYSLKDEVKIGEYFMKEQVKEFKRKKVGVDLPKHQALKSRIEKIVQRIAFVSDRTNFPYEVHIFDRPDIVNAYCLPGGKIAVFSGLFDKEKGLVDETSDDQIAAVIGHEIAHGALRHNTRRLSTFQGIGFLGSIASIGLGQGVGAQAQQIFDQVFYLGMNITIPNYSRRFEREADQAGLYYLSKARFNPMAAVEIWRKAAARGGPNSKRTDFFASHPASGERAKYLESWLDDAIPLSRGKIPAGKY